MKKTIYLIITVFLLFSCNSLEIREEKFNNGNPKIKYEVSELEDGSFKKNGFYKEWFDNGQIKITGNYNKNLKDGEWINYYISGKIMSKENYKNDQINGEFIEYYENDQIKQKYVMMNNLLEGKLLVWYSSGKKHNEINYKFGKKNGITREWNEDGELIKEMTYEFGKNTSLIGTWLNNNKVKLTYYKDGLCVAYYASGKESKVRYTFDNDELIINGRSFIITKINSKEYSGIYIKTDSTEYKFNAKKLK